MTPKRRGAYEDEEGSGKKRSKTTLDTTPTMRITRNMAATPPRNAVFDTTELLEAILVRLPFKDLFVSQRVSRRFRDVIQSSLRIQTRMFLRSCVARESWSLHSRDPPWPVPVPFGLPEFSELAPTSSRPGDNRRNPVTPAALSPLARLTSPDMTACERLHYREEFIIDLTRFWTRPGSWRDTLVTDPPCASMKLLACLTLEFSPFGPSGTKRYDLQATVFDDTGIKVSAILDAFLRSKKSLRPHPTQRINRRTKTWEILDSIGELIRDAKLMYGVVYCIPADMVIPTEAEWAEVRAKTA